MATGVTKVSGGIITDQMLTGSLRYFKMVGDFAPSVSLGTVSLDSSTAGGDALTTYYYVVGGSTMKRPVPGSLADWALTAIMEKCTVVEIGFVGGDETETELHFSAANTSFAWIDDDGNVDTVAMQDAVASIGATLTVPDVNGSVDDNTVAPVTKDASTTVTITEVPFNLA